ncbi:hypothetical protein INS49_002511 [Diaporthe citri]|uniref:uncharacterized protein n=1 Tax=Diaporthe citri TaxID=83186 RepID=UPI001C813A76|nr:uncharacterized protein INS49_002511 [Diaporthe citri]KAG6368306.1 hypothetical protein INS49_002511 [Diaporthe citri]
MDSKNFQTPPGSLGAKTVGVPIYCVVIVLFVFLFNFFIPIGFLGANFLYCTEIAPLGLRVAMSSISTANHWLWNFVVTMITPVAISTIGYQYHIVFTIIGFCIPVSVYFLYPETMGLRLEDIDLIFRESPSVMKTVALCPESGLVQR